MHVSGGGVHPRLPEKHRKSVRCTKRAEILESLGGMWCLNESAPHRIMYLHVYSPGDVVLGRIRRDVLVGIGEPLLKEVCW